MTPHETLSYSVYAHINKINGRRYIGCTSKTPVSLRWQYGYGYKNGQEKFYSAIEEFGWDGFEHVIIAEGLSQEDAWALEEKLIQEYDTINNRYNAAYGGKHNRLSEDSKKKLRLKRLGENNPNYNPNKTHTYKKSRNKYIQKRNKKNFYTFQPGETNTDGRKSIEFREKLRESKLREKNPNYGKHTWSFGKKYTEKQKQNMYVAWTDERKQLVSRQKHGAKNVQAKKVICVDTGVVYDTITEAAKMNNLSERTVSNSCNGHVKKPKIQFAFVKEGDIT